ncbi:MAG TPA: Flp pilus assembly protein CpaB [Acidobacteriaceae bacterium]|nr:Flp pilus assembly protein CpaB [Acidobacteriaceae bacterium]
MMLALVVALVISGLFTFWLSRRVGRAPKVAPPQNQQYVAAARSLDPGEIIRKEDLNLIEWPKSHPLAGSFVRVDDVVGRAVLYPLASGQPILDRQLAAAGSGMGLTARIPSGMRAIALSSNEVIGVAGFLMPGTHVDVLVTYHDPSNPDPITATVLQDAEVLAAGHQVQPDPTGKPSTVDVVTLLLSPEDAEKAVLASAQGSIHFVLRNGGDHAQANAAPVGLPQLASFPGKVHERRVVAGATGPAPWVVETMLGTKRTTASFN